MSRVDLAFDLSGDFVSFHLQLCFFLVFGLVLDSSLAETGKAA